MRNARMRKRVDDEVVAGCWAVLGLLLGWGVGGCGSPLVGGACEPGYTPCEGRCVDLDTDPGHCGACGLACAAEERCRAGLCVPLSEGGWPEEDGSIGDGGGAGDGGAGDGGGGCGLGEVRCEGRCVRPDREPDHCGGCGQRCGSGQVCAAGTCADRCEGPLAACAGLCVDLRNDPDHCGGCRRSCASGLCRDGSCVEGMVGHVVTIGHSYARRRRGMNRLLGNAVFLVPRTPVRVLLYTGTATASSRRGVREAIEQVAVERGRSWESQDAQLGAVTDQLAEVDVFVVLPQQAGTDSDLRDLGGRWQRALQAFVRTGGVVILLDGGGAHGGTWQLGVSAGLFEATARVDVSDDSVMVVAPGDAVALGVPIDYRAEWWSVRFEGTSAPIVVAHPEGPVVLHRVVLPGGS